MLNYVDRLTNRARGHGATDHQIADAQHSLGVRLPQSYKSFLSKFGWAMICGDLLYGLGADVPHGFTVVKNALSERYEAHPHIPHHLVPIMNDGAGNNYCLDTSCFDGDECPVVFWDHEHWDGPDQAPERVSPSFDRWLIDRIVDGLHADKD
jgi:SMI1-KNR4 cell-wall